MSWFALSHAPGGPVSSRAASVLRQLESDSVRHFGHPVAIEPLHEVVGTYSRVMRVRLHLRDGPVHAYVKLYEPRAESAEEQVRFRRYVVTEFERTRLARLCGTPFATVPHPIACLPNELLLITQQAAGIPLQGRLRHVAMVRTAANVTALLRDLRRVGAWLRVFQKGVPIFGHELQDARTYLDVRLRSLVARRRPAFTAQHRQAFLDAYDQNVGRLSSADLEPVPIHADLCPSNILVSDDAITVIDFAMSTDGTRCGDIAHLVMHLRLAGRRFRFGPRLTHRIVRALIDGFDERLSEDSAALRWAILPQLACHLAGAAERGRFDSPVLGRARFHNAVAYCAAMGGVRLAG